MNNLYEKAQEAAEFIRSAYAQAPRCAVVLGSGLGAFADRLGGSVKIPYQQIPHFPVSTAVGHAGRLVLGQCDGVDVVAMQGRFHAYEGWTMQQVTFPIRVFGLLGIKALVLTNMAGGVNLNYTAGTLMLIKDHINLMGMNPLCGQNDERFGPRFPDMTYVYSEAYRTIAKREAATLSVPLQEGVYLALSGPSYETPAEIRMVRVLGADAVGMSTVPEAIVGRHMGMEILGISLISNMAAGVLDQPLHHQEVLDMGERMGGVLTELLQRIIPKLVNP
ncbi:MAG: purine-nucleoside phosphorylase [Acidobacteriota bacterium]|nr:purine-nucleoside phosphorylase [Blastocatellia bacterium]MDW8240643.1 purine-nucleoside phosphorylase [Acidobacteriota bacterium]